MIRYTFKCKLTKVKVTKTQNLMKLLLFLGKLTSQGYFIGLFLVFTRMPLKFPSELRYCPLRNKRPKWKKKKGHSVFWSFCFAKFLEKQKQFKTVIFFLSIFCYPTGSHPLSLGPRLIKLLVNQLDPVWLSKPMKLIS